LVGHWHTGCRHPRKEFAEARETLEQATEQAPTEPYLWRLLSDALLQEGKDWNHAETALRRVLELDPNCHEVRNNLAVLLHQQSLAAT
jgi:Flp pilus assembly protein TadD